MQVLHGSVSDLNQSDPRVLHLSSAVYTGKSSWNMYIFGVCNLKTFSYDYAMYMVWGFGLQATEIDSR